jgi:hypothetical protein
MPCYETAGHVGDGAGKVMSGYHIIPCCNDGFHVEVAREKCNHPIRHNFAIFDQDTSEIPYNGWVISDFEARADRNLITASGYDLRPQSSKHY